MHPRPFLCFVFLSVALHVPVTVTVLSRDSAGTQSNCLVPCFCSLILNRTLCNQVSDRWLLPSKTLVLRVSKCTCRASKWLCVLRVIAGSQRGRLPPSVPLGSGPEIACRDKTLYLHTLVSRHDVRLLITLPLCAQFIACASRTIALA